MTYATRTSYRSPSQTRTRKMALVPRSARSHGRRLNVPEEIADLWLHRGVVAFFINPESTPNLATLLHCTQISAINFPPLCRGASLATHRSTLSPHFFPSSFSQRSFDLPILSLPPSSLFLFRVPLFFVSFRLTCRWQAFSTASLFSIAGSATYASSLRLHSPHCHWQTNLNGSIKSIRSNGT